MEKLQTLKDQMKETTLLEETAEDEAEKILKDLNLENMQLLSSDKIPGMHSLIIRSHYIRTRGSIMEC